MKNNTIRLILILATLGVFTNAKAQDFEWYDSPDNWQYTGDNYWVCATLENGSAKTRYADGTPVSESAAYDVTSNLNSDQCGFGWIRLDHREILDVYDEEGNLVRQLVWHKGGQDYPRPQPSYGWIDINDISSFDGTLDVPTAQNVPRRIGSQPATEGMAPIGMPLVSDQPLENGVPYWNSDDNKWDTTHLLGKGYEAEENVRYTYKMVPTSNPNGIPESWQYKQFTTSSRYNKYADGGANYGDGTAEYAWLMWNFLTISDGETKLGGGGQMRGLIKEGQEFYRCKVKSIKATAWKYNGDTQVGEITAWYIKTRGNPYSPWMYGWMIAEHRVKNSDGTFSPSVLHYNIASITFAANAGPDQTMYGKEEATVTLNGSASRGEIVNYSWLENDIEIGTGKIPTVDLQVGKHTIVLQVTDTANNISADTVMIKVENAPQEIKYEAEEASVSSGSTKPGGTGNYIDLSSGGNIQWNLPVYMSGTYNIAFNIAVPSASTRSMGVFINGVKTGTITSSSTDFSDQSVTVNLEEDDSTLIELRDTEGTAELNIDYLTLKYLNPLAISSYPNCTNQIKIYPNPLNEDNAFSIEIENNFHSHCIIEIYSMNGRKVYHKTHNVDDNNLTINNLQLIDSMYVVGIIFDKNVIYKKLITRL